MRGPCSAYQSASWAHFSISASASERIFPISVEMTFASRALFLLKAPPRSARSWARLWTESLRNARKLSSARATAVSICPGVKNENASISSPVDGLTVANPVSLERVRVSVFVMFVPSSDDCVRAADDQHVEMLGGAFRND